MSSIELLNVSLPISINGNEKIATGLTKQTTINDIIYAIILKTDSKFTMEQICDYALFEKYSDNERFLDGSLKVYKLIKYWKSQPEGNLLDKVKFVIKKRKIQSKLCTLSPAHPKTWNLNKAKRLEHPSKDIEIEKYSTIKSITRARKSLITSSDVKLIRNKYLQLLDKQTELLERQLAKMQKIDSRLRSKSTDRLRAVNLNSKLKESNYEINKQKIKINKLHSKLAKIDDVITLKTNMIINLENELKELENEELEVSQQLIVYDDEEICDRVPTKQTSTSSLASSASSSGVSSADSNDSFLETLV